MKTQATRAREARAKVGGSGMAPSPLEFLARHNVLYILSALLMLVGCLLISLPRPFHLVDLVGLLVVINLYEAMVIAATAWIARRAPACAAEAATARRRPASREPNVLLLVETAFLLDAHFTLNACVTADALWGPLIATASLALALAKVYLMARLTGGQVFAGLKRILLPAIVFVHAFQAVLVLARNASPAAREISTFALWLAMGALPLLLMSVRFSDRKDGTRGGMPWWRTAGFARAVGVLSIIVPLALLAGQTWAHDAPFSAGVLLPVVFSLLVAAPAIFPRANAESVRAVHVVVTAIGAVVAIATEELAWGAAPGLVLSPTRAGFVFGAAAFLLAFARERRGAAWNLAFALLALAALGHDAEHIAGTLLAPGAWHAGAVSALAFLWWLRGRSCERAVAATGVVILVTARAIEGAWPTVSAPLEFLRWMPAATLAISTAYDVRERLLRSALFALVFGLGAGGLAGTGAPGVVYFFAAFAALGVATLRGGRAYLIALAAYPVASAMVYWQMPLPKTPGQWGALVIVCAFGAFAGALAVTRLRMGRDGPDPLASDVGPALSAGADALQHGGCEGGGS
ncbi:MAG: hypothetical protein ACYTKD_00635 [Planctomycetota bacterium]|jgi:hypothetical protein